MTGPLIAGMRSFATPPEMISTGSTAIFVKSVSGQALFQRSGFGFPFGRIHSWS